MESLFSGSHVVGAETGLDISLLPWLLQSQIQQSKTGLHVTSVHLGVLVFEPFDTNLENKVETGVQIWKGHCVGYVRRKTLPNLPPHLFTFLVFKTLNQVFKQILLKLE